MRFLAAIVALCAAGLVILDARHWHTGDPRHASFRAVVISVLILLGLSMACQARPSPYPPPDQFSGDRYTARQAQMGADVAKSVKAKQGAKARRAAPTRRHAPRALPGWRQIPIWAPLAEPASVEPVENALDYRSRDSAQNLNTSVSLGESMRRVAAQTVGGRPQGCPHRFCGCALALKIFGRIVPVLNLAVNWARKFERSPPAPGMVAARHGHAFQLIAHVRGNTWRVWDANSGRGRIRIHERSIAGYQIVNPRSDS